MVDPLFKKLMDSDSKDGYVQLIPEKNVTNEARLAVESQKLSTLPNLPPPYGQSANQNKDSAIVKMLVTHVEVVATYSAPIQTPDPMIDMNHLGFYDWHWLVKSRPLDGSSLPDHDNDQWYPSHKHFVRQAMGEEQFHNLLQSFIKDVEEHEKADSPYVYSKSAAIKELNYTYTLDCRQISEIKYISGIGQTKGFVGRCIDAVSSKLKYTIHLSEEWMRDNFDDNFIDFVKGFGQSRFLQVPTGNPRPPAIKQFIPGHPRIKYRQGDDEKNCIPCCIASALWHMGLALEARLVVDKAKKLTGRNSYNSDLLLHVTDFVASQTYQHVRTRSRRLPKDSRSPRNGRGSWALHMHYSFMDI